MAKKKARIRSGHPGVVIIRRVLPSGRETWRARWIDPDTGKNRSQALERIGETSEAKRTRWAKQKSDEIQARKRALAKGATPHSETTIKDAIALYFKDADISESTRDNYRGGTKLFEEWCALRSLRSMDDLRPAHLAAFRAWLRSEPSRRSAKGKGRGKKVKTDAPPSAGTANARIRAVKVVLNELRRRGLLPHVDRDSIGDQLRSFKEPRPRAAFLKPEQLRDLLEAVRRHDEARWATQKTKKPLDPDAKVRTARELASLLGVHESRISQLRREPGWPKGPPWRLKDVLQALPARHEPAAPLILLALLTGARLEELLSLKWENVDLKHRDGSIEFVAEDVKTGAGRELWLDVTPSLKRLLESLKKRSSGPYVLSGDAPWTQTVANKIRARLVKLYGAPEFTFAQRSGRTPSLRASNATYSVNAGAVWGDAAHFTSAKRLGHSVAIAERRYAGRWRVPREARDLEEAMEVAPDIRALVDAVVGRRSRAESE